jgi:hypothetical protein
VTVRGRKLRTAEESVDARGMALQQARHLAGALLLLAALAACGDDEGDDESDAAVELPVITVDEEWNARPTAEVRGRLELENGCLVIEGHVVFWPNGTEWDGDAQTVIADGEVWATVGQGFSGGGGFYDATADYRELIGDQPGEALIGCIDLTGATGAVFAYGD